MIGTLVAPVLVAVLSHVVLPGIRNRIWLDRDALGRLFRFGRYVFLATIAGFFIAQGDKAVLAGVVSLGDFAVYNIAFFLASVPLLLARALDKAVMFPLYARRPPAASAANREKIGRARRLITGALLAGLGGLALTGDGLVQVLYDPRYHAAGPLMILIALAAMPGLITASYASLPLAAGHSGRYALLMVASAALNLALVILGARAYGMVGVILAPALGAVAFYPALIVLIRPYRSWDIRHDAGYFALAAVLAGSVVSVHHDRLASFLAAAGI
jgi:O-antigen/teichoic acid export membrane protein